MGNCQQKLIEVDSAQILLVLEGLTTLRDTRGEEMTLRVGQSVFIPAQTEAYFLTQSGQCCLVQC